MSEGRCHLCGGSVVDGSCDDCGDYEAETGSYKGKYRYYADRVLEKWLNGEPVYFKDKLCIFPHGQKEMKEWLTKLRNRH